jgi:ADP-ribose pyrophosphatase YjhB (NUDIX family)
MRHEKSCGTVIFRKARGKYAVLLIKNKYTDCWSFPKGHVEQGESSRVAAQREVEEETGIMAEVVGNEPLAYSYHTYNTYGEWELKRTAWWAMRSEGGEPKAQSEEGIAAVEWCERATLGERLKTTYPTIKRLVERYVLGNGA